MGHPQPKTPIQNDNSTAEGVINSKIQPKRTKAMDMQYHWLGDRHEIRILDQSQGTSRNTMSERGRTDQIQANYKLISYKGVLDFPNKYIRTEATYDS